ncbi:hypothetical protein CJJ09_002024 [Candidozyma auris]|nr:hypothetical protein CJJ09_002024 [[Candida] auris]
MGKASLASLSTPRLEPDQSSSNVCTTTAAVQGTVSNSSANVSALSSLYSLNRSNDDPKKKNIFASRDMRSMSQIKDTYPKSGSMPSRDLVVRPTILKSRESKKTDRRGKAKEASKILKNKGKNVTSTQEKERDERSRNNPYWMKIDNPSREMASDSIRCSRWADVFPPRIKRKLVKWRSLKAPAALPIATSLFPSPKELE